MLPIILPEKYNTKSCLENKTQVNATCELIGPAHSSVFTLAFLQEKHRIQRNLSRYRTTSTVGLYIYIYIEFIEINKHKKKLQYIYNS